MRNTGFTKPKAIGVRGRSQSGVSKGGRKTIFILRG
jgi:hypothetical protein